MRLSGAQWRRSVATCSAFLAVFLLVLSVPSAFSQIQPQPGGQGVPPGPDDIRDTSSAVTETRDKVVLRNASGAASAQGNKVAEKEATCLLPPLALMSSPTVAIEQLRRTAGARDEYQQGCTALRKKKFGDAERHLRNAVREYPKYALAWVTIGQLLATQLRIEEARKACFESSSVDPNYVPAHLCLADIAAQSHSWDQVLKLSERAIELDPSNSAVAYEYHAAANLNLHNLSAAEKSGLRALAIDREHREPRIHFVLAQIYEAKGDSFNEAVQLHDYLRYARSGPDAEMVEQVLTRLENKTKAVGAIDVAAATAPDDQSSLPDWAPPDIDARVPPVLRESTTCPLPQILKETSDRSLDLIENMRRFSATEHIEQTDIDGNGKRRHSTAQTVNYVAEIENNFGYPNIREYRVGVESVHPPVMDLGSAAFALIFHPSHIGNFQFRCEGLTDLQGAPAWQVHFLESVDPRQSFAAIRRGHSLQLTRLKGRAWITTDTYNVLRIETDLVNPIKQIDLKLQHQVIAYAPVEFPRRHLRLWLPESSSLHIAYRRSRYQRVHTFTEFQLFSVDSAEAVKEPIGNKISQYAF